MATLELKECLFSYSLTLVTDPTASTGHDLISTHHILLSLLAHIGT